MALKGQCTEVIKVVQMHFFIRNFGQVVALKVSQVFAVCTVRVYLRVDY